jgi:glycosyltransferase involved in cell wall biosynthesis
MPKNEVNPNKVDKADIAVGLASYNEKDDIAFVTRQAGQGMTQYFSELKGVVLNCDNNSPDGTKDVFLKAECETPKIYISTEPGIAGKGYNFENMFKKVIELDASILVAVDADLKSITPEWIKYFGQAIKEGYDYATPLYSRHKYDGTITNNLCLPIVYGLFCKNLRQPIGGDFAMSGRLVKYLMQECSWQKTTKEYGIDIFMTTNAICGDFKICKVGLGAKIHKPSAPKLGPMFVQVVDTLFTVVLNNIDKWKDRNSIEELKLFGLKELGEPQDLTMDVAAIKEKSSKGFYNYREILKTELPLDIFETVEKMISADKYEIEKDLWVKIVYNMIAAYGRTKDTASLTEGFRGLYFGRAASFMDKTWKWSNKEAEKEILEQAKLFHKERGRLISLL